MQEPAQTREGVRAVSLAGRDWPIPEFCIRQLRATRRPLIDLTNAINPVVETDAEGNSKVVTSTGERVLNLSPALFDQMCDVVYCGLAGGSASLTRDEFDSLKATDAEIFLAFLVVRRQSGIFVDAQDTGPRAPEKKDPTT